MDPVTVLILSTIKAVAEAVTEGFRYGQTPAGQAFGKKLLEDAAAREKAWDDAGTWLKNFVRGELLK